MSNYVKSTNFASKDSLASGNPLKIVKGAEIDTEFNNIATAVATKADLNSPSFSGTPSLPTGTTAVTQSTGDNSTKLSTTAFVQAALQAIYPVGSVYTNASDGTNPASLLGFGTWTAFGAGRVPVGFQTSDALFGTVGNTGGSRDAIIVSHTHTATFTGSALPAHSHTTGQSFSGGGGNGATTGGTGLITTTSSVSAGTPAGTVAIDPAGSSGTNANLPPYVTVYMWRRTT